MRIKSRTKKPEHLTPKMVRQIELLKKYYDIDVENKIIYLELHYESVDELLHSDLSCKETPRFNNEVVSRVSGLMDTFPQGFDVDLTLKIDDYKGYNPKVLMSSFKDSLEIIHYSFYKEKKANWVLAAILVIVSASLIGLRLFALNSKIINDNGVIQEMVDITGWVFLWEAVTILFLTQSEQREISRKVTDHLSAITFIDKDGKTLEHVNNEELTANWLFETKKQRNGRVVLLIAGAACFAYGVISFFDGLTELFKILMPAEGETPPDARFALISMGINFFIAVLYCAGGFGAISMFKEKGPLQKVVPVFAWVMFIFDILYIGLIVTLEVFAISSGVGFLFEFVFSAFQTTAVTILYFIGYTITKKYRYKAFHRNKAKA